jgi:putative nucleotidyltransferase with HDIG domain
MADSHISIRLEQILIGEVLPTNLYVHIDGRFILFRAAGDTVDRSAFDRLQVKNVTNLFILETDRASFEKWLDTKDPEASLPPRTYAGEVAGFPSAREEAHRKALDIFQRAHPIAAINEAVEASKKLVAEVMKFPYAAQSMTQLQTFSRGVADHSVNVSVLSVYLAMQMGYSHTLILQHVGAGGLLHDIGKRKITVLDGDSADAIAAKMKEHPTLGARLLEGMERVPNEVKMIVAQHHEYQDGTGYPKKLRGSAIYDLARIVGIANTFDELVSDGQGTLVARQRNAIVQLDQVYGHKFDAEKLDKAIRILKLGV